MDPENRPIFPRIPFRKLQASFQKPGVEEGFVEIVEVEWEVSLLSSSSESVSLWWGESWRGLVNG